MGRPIKPTDDPGDLDGDDWWAWMELTFHGLPAPPRDKDGVFDMDAFLQWVAAGFSMIFVDMALRQGRTQADGLREAADFMLRKDDVLSRGVRPYLAQAELGASTPASA